jgi:acyl-CoA synthetase (AMP-forming)/AMP-acid ligase II
MSHELLRLWDGWRGSLLCEQTARRWPADDLRRQTSLVTNALAAAGVRERDVVVLVAANTVGFPVALLACLQQGACPLLLHAATPAPELDAVVAAVGARFVVHDFIAGVSRIDATRGNRRWQSLSGPGSLALARCVTDAGLPPPALSEPATLLHATSGTYGRPQLCDRPQRAAVAEARNYVETLGLFARAHVVVTTPLHHAFAFGFGLIAALLADASLELRPQFHPARTLDPALPDVDLLAVVPPMLPLLARVRGRGATRTIRHCFFAGAPCPEEVASAFSRAFGQPLFQIYGTTETGGIASTFAPGAARAGAGLPLRGVAVTIDGGGRFPELGCDAGEICVRSTSMMAGYLGTARAAEPWHTGDLGRVLASGEVELRGRLRDIINVGGSKVDPREVEEILHRHPAIKDVAVYAGQSGGEELVQAAVCPRDAATAGELRRFCEQYLASHKVPQVIHFLDAIPRTPSGKCQRNQLPDAMPERPPGSLGEPARPS